MREKLKAAEFLRQKNISYKIANYSYRGMDATGAAKEIGLPAKQIAKSMLVKLKNSGFALLILPCEMKIEPTLVKRNFNSRFRLATPEETFDVTGYNIGLVSPFNLKKLLQIYIHSSLLLFDQVGVGSGIIGIEIILDPNDLKQAVKAEILV